MVGWDAGDYRGKRVRHHEVLLRLNVSNVWVVVFAVWKEVGFCTGDLEWWMLEATEIVCIQIIVKGLGIQRSGVDHGVNRSFTVCLF